MLDPRAICETCGHTRDWHDRDAERARLGSDPPVERPCYREVGGAACRCGGFRESGMFAMPRSLPTRDSAPGLAIVRVGALALLLGFLGVGLLYAYRSQTPSVPQVGVAQAIQDINAGRVGAVTVTGSTVTIEFRDSPVHREQTTLPQPDTALAPAVANYNAANPSQAIALRYEQGTQPIGVVGPIVLSLLPILLIAGFFYYTMRTRRGS
ncbi:MAG TPA: hypothetical protein VIN63_05400 [Candidatus Limnocylindria bacterium]